MEPTLDLTIYRLIHRGMRRDTARLGVAVSALHRPDRRSAASLVRWYDGFLTEFHGHHTVEDELFFPALAERMSGFATLMERVDVEHAALNQALEALDASLRALAAPDERWEPARRAVLVAVGRAEGILTPHLDFEDEEILPLFTRHMDKRTYDTLSDRATKQNGLKGLLWSVPWVVSQTEGEERDAVLRDAPLPLRLIWRATRRRYDRLVGAAFAGAAVPLAGPFGSSAPREVA